MNKNEKKEKKLLKKMNAEKEKLENKKPFKEKVKSAGKAAKEYFIKDTSKMIILVAIVIAIYLVVNLWVSNITLAQIDLTAGKLHTLTDQSKNIAKTVEKKMTFYLWQYTEDSAIVDLLKQYNMENSKIDYKIVESTDLEIIEEYGFEDDYPAIVGESEDGRNAYLSSADLYTYDSSFNIVDLTEQKLTNAICNLASTEDTKVYFWQGRTAYTTDNGLELLSTCLTQEYYTVDVIDCIADPTIPDDCDVLAIMGLASDLSTQEADNICAYIEKGGDLIITNDIDYVNGTRDYPNFQRVLDEYAISMPNKLVQEISSNAVSGGQGILIQSNIAQDHEITRLLYNYSIKPILLGSGIIELNTEEMAKNNITATPILMSSTEAILSDLSTKTYEESTGSYYVLGAAIQKMVESGDESRLVVFASTTAFSDTSPNNSDITMFDYNASVILNSFAYSANKGELYSIRKTQSDMPFTVTEEKDKVVKIVIYVVPFAIAALGICVWLNRRKLK